MEAVLWAQTPNLEFNQIGILAVAVFAVVAALWLWMQVYDRLFSRRQMVCKGDLVTATAGLEKKISDVAVDSKTDLTASHNTLAAQINKLAGDCKENFGKLESRMDAGEEKMRDRIDKLNDTVGQASLRFATSAAELDKQVSVLKVLIGERMAKQTDKKE